MQSAELPALAAALIEARASNTIFCPLITFKAPPAGIGASFTIYDVVLAELSVIVTDASIAAAVVFAISHSNMMDTLAAGDA